MPFDLLIEPTTRKIAWKLLHTDLQRFAHEAIELFPITADITGKHGGLGLSVHQHADLHNAKVKLRGMIVYLLNNGYKIFELYEGRAFSLHNMDNLLAEFSMLRSVKILEQAK